MLGTIKKDLFVYYKRECSWLDIVVGFFRISGFRAVFLYRIGNALMKREMSFVAFFITRIIRATCNMDIELSASIGVGLRIPHPLAIVIGGKSTIGDYCTLMQGVTIGGNGGKVVNGRTQPKIGSNVFLGPGAKVLGPVVIGDNAKIGANAVVINDIAAGSLAVGVPAKIVEKD